ncbi:Isoflavone reductase-like protein [Purpureocillium lavendulum]|uniref:Isoflavone reductase-like protein n=1 Tax=Purpureocillium lavendulum TaxID=1247861 RepID=A0AB34FGR7_9HYPO|nr:Isoflavone reductase-like protein [Purpureocillium lavendulum]
MAATCSDGAHDADELDTEYLEVASQYDIMQLEISEEGPFGAHPLRQVSHPSHSSSKRTESGCGHSTFTGTIDTPLPALNEATLDSMALLTVWDPELSERAPQVLQLGNESLFYAGSNWWIISARGSSMDSDAWKRWGMVFDVDGVEI